MAAQQANVHMRAPHRRVRIECFFDLMYLPSCASCASGQRQKEYSNLASATIRATPEEWGFLWPARTCRWEVTCKLETTFHHDREWLVSPDPLSGMPQDSADGDGSFNLLRRCCSGACPETCDKVEACSPPLSDRRSVRRGSCSV